MVVAGDEFYTAQAALFQAFEEASPGAFRLTIADLDTQDLFEEPFESLVVRKNVFQLVGVDCNLHLGHRLSSTLRQPSLGLPKPAVVSLRVYDALGREMATLVNELQEAGHYTVTFDASDLPSGVYLYRLTTNTFTQTQRMILLK